MKTKINCIAVSMLGVVLISATASGGVPASLSADLALVRPDTSLVASAATTANATIREEVRLTRGELKIEKQIFRDQVKEASKKLKDHSAKLQEEKKERRGKPRE